MSRRTAPAEILSCERIQAKFGSYGVDVLESDAGRRVSSLYSLAAGEKICRTYAQVRFAPEIDPAFAAEHARVLAGESIGTVFHSAGWAIAKRNRHIGETMLPDHGDEIVRLMRIEGTCKLATHTYVFEIAKDGRRFDYAVITELHHPAYLTAAELAGIYGEPGTARLR
ncbi:MAG TPA: hypothetical protein VHG33_12870 [Woeseiaceae bacterium]|nr:hypothetical protein [Woeseiaceae bacterium]